MTTATTRSTTEPETMEDLVEGLGDIPLWRILVNPPPGHATEADVLEAKRRYNRRCELVDGILVEKPMRYRESLLAAYLIRCLLDFVDPLSLGLVSAPDATMRLFTGLLRLPDVAYASWDRFPGRRVPDEPVPSLTPDLVIEVLSESNTAAEMARKRGEYFTSGVRVIWEVNPESRTVTVFLPDGNESTLSAGRMLDGGEVLPGFSLDLDELFGRLDRHG